MMLGKRLAIRAALTGPLLSALAFQATAEEIEWESWRVGVCHVQQQNGRFAQFGAPYRTSADKLEGRQASSYESKVMGLRVLAIDGIENPGWDDIVKVARQDLYLEEGRLTFTTEINGVRQERELPACVEITTANGETLIPGWDRVIAILMMDTLSEILFKKDGLWKPELRGGKLVIMEDKKHHYFTDQAIMEFHELGPGRIAAAFYIDEENLFVMEKLLNARGLNYKTLDGDWVALLLAFFLFVDPS